MTSSISNILDPVSSAIKNVKYLADGDIKSALLNSMDPGEVFVNQDTSADSSVEEIEEDLTVFEDTEKESIADDVATEAKKKKKKVTQDVLTSPLGSTETAKTAVAKLGGY